jgi:endonuclease YncB( thermonuclease family)
MTPEQTQKVLGVAEKQFALRPAPIPFTPGQMPNLKAQQSAPIAANPTPTKPAPTRNEQWNAINAKYAEGSDERKAGQIDILQREFSAATDPGTKAVLQREIRRIGGALPDADAMEQMNSTPPATEVGAGGGRGSVNPTLAAHIAPDFQRPEDAKAKVSSTTASFSGNGQATKTDTPVNIPSGTKWKPPVTVAQAAQPGGERAVVTYVDDGDTARLKRDKPGKYGSDITCRIDTIDAPETAKPQYGKEGQAFGEESKRILKNMIDNKQVTIRVTKEVDPSDKSSKNNYGRSLCQIEVEGVGVDKEMLRKGAAWLYRTYKDNPELSQIEATAIKNKVGLHANPNAENPDTVRRRQR